MGQESPGEGRWRERPVLGAALQALLTVIPLAIGAGVGVGVGRWLAAAWPAAPLGTWAAAGTAAMLTVWAVQPLVRRAVPLAWLLRLGMLWPGRAPSRFRVARDAGRVRDLEARLRRAREVGVEGEPEQAAETILTLTAALTSHDRRTRGHAERVRIFTELLGLELGLPQHDRDRLRWAALLHDIGKLEVPARILNKPGRPDAREWEQLRSHPEAGDRLLAPLRDWLGEWSEAALHHHERWDGDGYPNGLAGTDISRAGRIVAVADAYEVMTAARSYKRPMGAAAAREELVTCAGGQFDPSIVRAFLLIPLWRLRWALGPFSWVAQLPVARDVVHATSSVGGGAVTAGAGAAAGAAAIAVGSTLHPPHDVVPSTPAGLEVVNDEAQAALRAALPSPTSGQAAPRPDDRPGNGTDTAPPAGRDEHASAPDDERDEGASDPDGTSSPTAPGDGDPDDGTNDAVDGAGDAVDRVVDDTTDTVDEILDDTTDTADKVVDDTTDTADKVVDDTTDTADKVADDTRRALEGASDDPAAAVDGAVEDTTDTADKVVDDTADTADKVVDDTTDTVRGVLGR